MKKVNVSTSLAKKFIILSAFTFMVPLICFVIFASRSYSDEVDGKLEQMTDNMLGLINKNIDYIINDVEDTANLIITSQSVQTVLSANSAEKSQTSYYLRESEVYDLLMNITNNKKYIGSVYLGNDDYSIGKDKKYIPARGIAAINHQAASGLLRRIIENKGKGIWFRGDMVTGFDKNLLVYTRLVRNLYKLNNIGILMIGIDATAFTDMFSTNNPIYNTEIHIRQGAKVIFNYCPAGESTLQSLTEKETNRIRNRDGLVTISPARRFYVRSIYNANASWTITSITPYDLFYREKQNTLIFFVSLALLSFLFGLGCVSIFTKNITKTLKQLRKYVADLKQGKKEKEIVFSNQDEVGMIGNEFMRVVKENEKLTINLYKSLYKEKEAELIALQSQINPHFLYNTLDSIFWMAEEHNVDEISRMVIALSSMFKLSLNNGEKFISLQKELQLVLNYLEIQAIRYEGKFTVKMDIDDGLMEMKVIKFILQPLVENAICHGIAPKESKGQIMISAKRISDNIIIAVADDGVGFNRSISEVLEKGYALKNVNDRIKLYYGEEYGVFIDENAVRGSKVSLKIKAEFNG